ncbi:MAG: tRNA 4-thiouridine(8) synthase ThiI [Desulfarculales bacterium]|jgi:tRNA U34 2-thiouridine synthase MnmA/TrmU|nr:tRNA 4-thiouridine(8) synthase ThiI [Desulfarculales bacterium]
MARALGLLSGGLDSTLATLLMRKAGIETVALTFVTPFFSAAKAKAASAAYGFELREINVAEEHLQKVVKNPRYGYGSNMNPCIDCHAFMLKKAGLIMEAEGFDFIYTGEVLGQRPMSQNPNALKTVAKASGYGDRILRPLSAGRLTPTPMEENGLVKRELLGSLYGRGRKTQMALAEEMGMSEYPAPGGGCLLTDPGFSRRLKDLLHHQPDCRSGQIEMLKHGRHFRLSPHSKLIVGRNHDDNTRLQALMLQAGEGITSIELLDQPGPLGLFSGRGDDLEPAAAIVAGYTPGQEARRVQAGEKVLTVRPMDKSAAREYIL